MATMLSQLDGHRRGSSINGAGSSASISQAIPSTSSSRPNFFAASAPYPPPPRSSDRAASSSSPQPNAPSNPSSSSRIAAGLSMSAFLALHRSSSSAPPPSDCGGTLLPPVPEALLLRDILYIFQGIDGHFIRFRQPPPSRTGPKRTYVRGEIVVDGRGVADDEGDDGAAANDAEAHEYEQGIEFVLADDGYSLPAPTRTLLHQLSELGWLYRKIDAALHKSEAERAGAGRKGKAKAGTERRDRVGMVEQSLHAELHREMTEYFMLVAVLEGKLEGVEAPEVEEGATAGGERLCKVEGLEGGLTLRKLDVWTQDIRLRMRMMGTLVAEVGGANVGGAFLTTLHSYTSNGDPFIRTFSSQLLKTLSVPFFATLSSWIYHGELRDPYGEFFVELNPALGGTGDERWRKRDEGEYGSGGYEVGGEEAGVQPHELWADKFAFRKEMLPGFLEESFGRKIFSTGKSLNFMKYSCSDTAWVVERNRAEDRTLEYADMASLERSISLAYSTASQRLFELFFDKFKLMDHLRALKDYLMLGKGDFCEILMEQLGPSLGRPANTLYRHNLTSTLETAIRGSNPTNTSSSFASSLSDSILRRLDARMLDFEQGQVGWDVFLLEYKVDAPLSTVLDPQSLEGYRTMFKHLWEIKRVEYSLNEAWRTLMTNTRLLKKGSAVSFDLHQTRISLAEMIFFVRQVEYYCHLEVVACQWAELEEFVARKEGDLDKLIEAHRRYLGKLVDKALLKASAKRHRREAKPLVEQLRDIFKVMLQYKNVADDLFAYAMQHESHARSAQDTARGLPSPILARAPSTDQLMDLENRLADYSARFREKAQELVVGLERSPDLDMKFLAVRLNFNHSFRPEPTGAKSEA
ncbi:hypothetical protein JCM5296_000151 [Sporobolomyces johnsonii]